MALGHPVDRLVFCWSTEGAVGAQIVFRWTLEAGRANGVAEVVAGANTQVVENRRLLGQSKATPCPKLSTSKGNVLRCSVPRLVKYEIFVV